MKKPGFKFILISGVLVILVANGFVLASVTYNRSSIESELKLTDRELTKTYTDKEGSGMELNLNWRIPQENPWWLGKSYCRNITGFVGYIPSGSPKWLDKAKLAQLGFDVSMPVSDTDAVSHYRNMREKEVFIVLELDGTAYQTAIKQMKDAIDPSCWPDQKTYDCELCPDVRKNMIWQEENISNRLYAVDAGLDDATLRARYPDRSKYAIIRGQIRPELNQVNGGPTLMGYLVTLGTTINVPYRFIGELKDMNPRNPYTKPGEQPKHYEVAVAFGRDHEPWIVSATKVTE